MKHAIIIILAATLAACSSDKGGPTAPSYQEPEVITSGNNGPPPSDSTGSSGAPVDVPAAPRLDGPGIQQFAEGKYSASINNRTGREATICIGVYVFETAGGSVQRLVASECKDIQDGSSVRLAGRFPVECGRTYQADLVTARPPARITDGNVPHLASGTDRTADKWSSAACPGGCVPEYEEHTEIVKGEYGQCILEEGNWGEGVKTRTVTTTVTQTNSCNDEVELISETVTEETEECSIECEAVNEPEFSDPKTNVTSTRITASYRAHNKGTFSLILFAGSPQNPYDFEKKQDTDVVKCGESSKLAVSYRHKGHGSCLWTLRATGPISGWPVEHVVLDRCDS